MRFVRPLHPFLRDGFRAGEGKFMTAEEKRGRTLRFAGPLFILTAAVLVAVDQITKYAAVVYLKGKDAAVLIKNVLELRYLENSGAAWGMLQNRQWIFALITIAFLSVIAFFMAKIPKTAYYRPLMLTLAVLCAGAVGNFIDRIRQSYVVDFIYFKIIDFPVFNVADICVTLSVIALLILILFHYKDKDFNFVRRTDGNEEHKD
jgi:signal peptidase II